jgi:sec-independent protein translocase protein TatC
MSGTEIEPRIDPNAVSREQPARSDEQDARDGADVPRGRARKEMPFLEHLEELRKALIDSLWGVVIGSGIGWFVAPRLIDFLIRPAGQLVFLGPADALNLRMKASFFVGIILASPLVLWKLWSFVAPGLLPLERRLIAPLVVSSTTLFITGLVFADLVLAPLTFKFLLSFQSENMKPLLTADAYFGFLAKLCIAFGAMFQLPVVIGILSWAGVIPARFLVARWREAVLIILLVAAILTPPDVVSQILMAGPILILYTLSIGIAFLVERRRKRNRDVA